MAGDSIIVISQIEKTADRRIKESEKKMSDVIVLEDVTKRYGNEEVVKNASMHVKEGEIYGFLGPNGAGKTTVMKLILNLAKPDCGNIRVFGDPVLPDSYTYLRYVGNLIETPCFYEKLSAGRNLRLHCEYMGIYEEGRIEQALEQAVPEQKDFPPVIFEAMRYSLLAGGKRLRPMMVLAACEAVGGKKEDALPFACALEMIHTYSLIHDDLPAMDNDDYRRGRLTNHKVFGEDMAILAGDGLLHHAMETMADACVKNPTPQTTGAMKAIAHGAGVEGMLVGQVVDVFMEGKPLDIETLDFIHLHKTAAMIRGALQAGAICGGADEKTVAAFALAGEKIGIAFQILDDILDVTSTLEELGKPIHSDEKNQKTTYVTLFGIEKSREIAARLSAEAVSIWEEQGEGCAFLLELTKYLTTRTF